MASIKNNINSLYTYAQKNYIVKLLCVLKIIFLHIVFLKNIYMTPPTMARATTGGGQQPPWVSESVKKSYFGNCVIDISKVEVCISFWMFWIVTHKHGKISLRIKKGWHYKHITLLGNILSHLFRIIEPSICTLSRCNMSEVLLKTQKIHCFDPIILK